MSDNSPSKKAAGIKQAWGDPKARKGLLIAGGALVVIGGSALLMMGGEAAKTPQAPASARVVPPPNGQRDVTAGTNEQYKKLVDEQDKERAEAAKTNPTSVVMPTLAGFASSEEEARRKREAEEAAERGRRAALTQGQQQQQFQTSAQAAGAAGPQGPTPADLARNTAEYKATQTFLAGVVSGAVPGAFQAMRAPGAAPGGAAGAAAPGTAGAAGNAPVTAAAQVAPVVRAGEIVFGTTDIAMNSDYSGPVTATVRQGKYSGWRLIGEKKLERDALVVRFNLMSPANGGESLQVNAYAVSLGDARQFGLTGLAGETDHHIFQRYILPAAAAFAQTYGMSAAMKGSTTTVGNGGAVGSSTPGLTSQDRANVAFGAAMGPIVADVTRNSQRPITVSMPANTEIGIMFAADVLPAGKAAAAAAPAPAGAVAGPAGAAAPGVRSVDIPGMAALNQQAQQAQAQAQAASMYQMPAMTMPQPGYFPAAPGVVYPGAYTGYHR